MEHIRQSLKRADFGSFWPSRSGYCSTVNPLLLFALGVYIFFSQVVYAHYPFPCSQEEKEKAEKIDQAQNQRDQQGVDDLIRFLGDENHRVKTAAFLSLIYLSPFDFNMDRAVPIADQLKDGEQNRVSAYSIAASKVFLILHNPALPDAQKQDKMIELLSAEDGALRRMAIEGLKAYGDQTCLPALAERINDSFGDHDDSYDMRAVSRVAFEVWWKIKSANLNTEQQVSTIIATLEEAQPFSSRWGDAACDLLEGMEYAAVPQLIEVYSGKSCNTRAWAARTLRKPELWGHDRKRVRTIAIGDLRSKDQSQRWTAAYLLERFSDKEDLDLFVELLANHDDPWIRDFAARRLGELGGAKAITALKGALLEDDLKQTRVIAAATLAALGQKEGHELLLESFASLDITRNIALGAIEYMDQDQVCARMLELLTSIETFHSDDERQGFLFAYARADLFRYLDKMPAHKLEPAIPTLKSLLKYPDDSISRSSANLLKKLGVALKWKYDIGQKRGWYEVEPATGAGEAGKASTAKKTTARLTSADRNAAEAELKEARQLLYKYRMTRNDLPKDSPEVLAAFEKVLSASETMSEKYTGSDIRFHSHVLIELFMLYNLSEDEKRAGKILDVISARFGPEYVSDAYFELGLEYLQGVHDPARALKWFGKIPMPPAPDADDKSPNGMHRLEQIRHTYVKVQQPMAKCEVLLGEPEKAEKRYNKLIELFPELKKPLEQALVFEVKSILTIRPRNRYWLSLSGLKQKLYQRSAARWLEDYEGRQAQIEEKR